MSAARTTNTRARRVVIALDMTVVVEVALDDPVAGRDGRPSRAPAIGDVPAEPMAAIVVGRKALRKRVHRPILGRPAPRRTGARPTQPGCQTLYYSRGDGNTDKEIPTWPVRRLGEPRNARARSRRRQPSPRPRRRRPHALPRRPRRRADVRTRSAAL